MQIVVNPLVVPTYDTKLIAPVFPTPEDRTINSPSAEEWRIVGGHTWRVRRKQVWDMWPSHFVPGVPGERLLEEFRLLLTEAVARHENETSMEVELIEARLKPMGPLGFPKTKPEQATLKMYRWVFEKEELIWGATKDLKETLTFGEDSVLTRGQEFLYVCSQKTSFTYT